MVSDPESVRKFRMSVDAIEMRKRGMNLYDIAVVIEMNYNEVLSGNQLRHLFRMGGIKKGKRDYDRFKTRTNFKKGPIV